MHGGMDEMTDGLKICPDYYRDMASMMKQLAYQTRVPSIRRNLISIAKRYDVIADYWDNKSVNPLGNLARNPSEHLL